MWDPAQHAALQQLLASGAGGGGAALTGNPGSSAPPAGQPQNQPLVQHAQPQWLGPLQAAASAGGGAAMADGPLLSGEGAEEGEEEEGEESDDGEDGGGGRQASRRERNRIAAARYRQRQKEQQEEAAAQLAAGEAQREQLLAERRALCTEQRALLATQAVQHDLHAHILAASAGPGPATWSPPRSAAGSPPAALHGASNGHLPAGLPSGTALAASALEDGPISGPAALSSDSPPGGTPGQPGPEEAQRAEAVERQFVCELQAVVQAGGPEAAAQAALRMLPAIWHPVLDASPQDFLRDRKSVV